MSKLESNMQSVDKADPAEASQADGDYLAWKKAKILRALRKSDERGTMYPASEVWERFGFER